MKELGKAASGVNVDDHKNTGAQLLRSIFVDKATYGLNVQTMWSTNMNAIDCAGLNIMFGKEANDNSRLFVRLDGTAGRQWYQINMTPV